MGLSGIPSLVCSILWGVTFAFNGSVNLREGPPRFPDFGYNLLFKSLLVVRYHSNRQVFSDQVLHQLPPCGQDVFGLVGIFLANPHKLIPESVWDFSSGWSRYLVLKVPGAAFNSLFPARDASKHRSM